MNTVDNICAIATGTSGAISIMRISGANALEIGNKIWQGETFCEKNARKMLLGKLGNDQVLGVYFKAPKSYTGENIIEFHCHGGVRTAKAALEIALQNGCRMAEAGEFTFRAFVNGKMDLVQAEAVCDLIESQNNSAMRLAERQLEGALSACFAKIREELIFALSECESRLDFPDEVLDWDNNLVERIAKIIAELKDLSSTFGNGSILRNGIKTVIAGNPNAGKSSLLNLLLGYDRAIVTEIAGTTRDTLEEFVSLRNIPTRLIDTAGLREDSNDVIENMGIARSRKILQESDVVFWVLDASDKNVTTAVKELEQSLIDSDKVIAIWNKIDCVDASTLPKIKKYKEVKISVATQNNIEELLDIYEKMVWDGKEHEEIDIAVNSRHLEKINLAINALENCIPELIEESYELSAMMLQEAIHQTGEITGETVNPDILGEIFSRFCIGK